MTEENFDESKNQIIEQSEIVKQFDEICNKESDKETAKKFLEYNFDFALTNHKAFDEQKINNIISNFSKKVQKDLARKMINLTKKQKKMRLEEEEYAAGRISDHNKNNILVIRGGAHVEGIAEFLKKKGYKEDNEREGSSSGEEIDIKQEKTASSGMQVPGGIDLKAPELNINSSSSAIGFDLPPETIQQWRNGTGITFDILEIQKDVDINEILSLQKNK